MRDVLTETDLVVFDYSDANGGHILAHLSHIRVKGMEGFLSVIPSVEQRGMLLGKTYRSILAFVMRNYSATTWVLMLPVGDVVNIAIDNH